MRRDLGEMEERFADLIWAHAPTPSGELVRLCEAAFGWKKSTTYRMLGRLCQRGLFRNEGGAVTQLLSPEQYRARKGQALIDESFGGSLPVFLAAFTGRRKLSQSEIDALQALIDASKEEG